VGGATATVISVLVNGQEVIRTIQSERGDQPELPPAEDLAPPESEGEEGGEEEEEEPREVRMQVITQTPDGATSTTLDISEQPCLFIQAWCEEVGKGLLGEATDSISFALESGQRWVTLTPSEGGSAAKSARIEPTEAMQEEENPQGVVVRVSAVLADQPVSVRVQIEVTRGDYLVRVS